MDRHSRGGYSTPTQQTALRFYRVANMRKRRWLSDLKIAEFDFWLAMSGIVIGCAALLWVLMLWFMLLR